MQWRSPKLYQPRDPSRPKSGPVDQPNIQEDLSPQVPDVDGVEEVGMDGDWYFAGTFAHMVG